MLRQAIPRLAIFLSAVAVAATLRADYKVDFRNGYRAYSRGRWAEVADSMRKAIAENGRESNERINISGTEYVAYTPHFYLGVALAKLGKCNEARPELATSEGQGVIQKFDYVTLRQTRDACGPAPTPPAVTASTAPEKPPIQPSTTQRTEVATATAATDTRAAPVPTPVPVASLTNTAPPPQPPSLTTTQPAPDALAASKRALKADVDGARSLLATNNRNAASPRASTARARLTGVITTATNALTSTSPAAVTSADGSLRAAVNDYRLALASPPPPPPTLADAIRAYSAGDYGRAVNLLAGTDALDPVYRAQVMLFRAASRYSQYVVSGERDPALKQQIAADLREYRRLKPNQAADPRYFSPKFRTLVAQTR